MKYVAHDGTAYVCYLSDNGIRRQYLGCAHDKPRDAYRHTAPAYAPASRSAHDSPALPAGGTRRGPIETPVAGTTASHARNTGAAIPPAAPVAGL